MELETFRDIVCRQIDTLQGYFDACAELSDKHGGNIENGDQHDDIFGSTDGRKCEIEPFHLTIPRKLLNPELSNKIERCDHSNESISVSTFCW